MSTYAIGDIQGCYNYLEKLLEQINFDPQKDILWFTGDLVNRGPQSLETLRFVKQLGSKHHMVLGNHDLHLLAVAHGAHDGWKEDTLSAILTAPDRDELIHWLLHQPLLHHDEKTGFTMIHAGLAANWDLATAKRLAKEVESILQSSSTTDFFRHMYGDFPDQWNESLAGFDRMRCITNFFTRARFCHADGRLELKNKGTSANNLMPWFRVPNRTNTNLKIIFGHWAALGGVTNTPHVYALDTGCIWGYALTAMRLEDEKRFSVSCR
jgi:bis(5'-nucleosyl)-tetraphosphatase (symmetrical)